MNKILVLSGKRNSGKSSLANFLCVHTLNKEFYKVFNESFSINNNGRIVSVENDCVVNFETVNPIIKKRINKYSFAEPLKKMCEDIFMIPSIQTRGSESDKNTFVKYRWENMPGKIPLDKNGYMTAREFMQYMATEIFRTIDKNIWCDCLFNTIKKECSELAIIDDCRFPNEVETAKRKGARVIRLTRTVSNDGHSSETILDPDKFNWNAFDYVLDNSNISLEESWILLKNKLIEWNWL